MILLTIYLILSLITTGLYVYFVEYLNGNILYYTAVIVFIVSMIAYFLLTMLFLMVCLLFRPIEKSINSPTKFYHFFTTQVAVILTLFFGIKIKKENMDSLPKNEKFLLISNHQSLYDPIAIIGLLRKYRISYIMKDGIMKLPFVGRWLYAAGYLPIDRNNDRNALKTIITASKRLEKGDPIGVYPEGTRSKTSEINRFRNGIFKIAQKAKAPIVVCLIDNFYTVKKRFPFRWTKVLFRVCEVIPYEKIKDLTTNEIGDMCRNILLENQAEVRKNNKWIEKKPVKN